MKIYLVVGKAYTTERRIIVDEILGAFLNEDNAKNFILTTWPEVHLECDDTYGMYYMFGPTGDFEWIARYFIKEMEVQDSKIKETA